MIYHLQTWKDILKQGLHLSVSTAMWKNNTTSSIQVLKYFVSFPGTSHFLTCFHALLDRSAQKGWNAVKKVRNKTATVMQFVTQS